MKVKSSTFCTCQSRRTFNFVIGQVFFARCSDPCFPSDSLLWGQVDAPYLLRSSFVSLVFFSISHRDDRTHPFRFRSLVVLRCIVGTDGLLCPCGWLPDGVCVCVFSLRRVCSSPRLGVGRSWSSHRSVPHHEFHLPFRHAFVLSQCVYAS